MSQHEEEQSYGRKGACFGWFLVFLILFIIMLIWIYWKNQAGLS